MKKSSIILGFLENSPLMNRFVFIETQVDLTTYIEFLRHIYLNTERYKEWENDE